MQNCNYMCIKEDKSKYLPGVTSLFIEINSNSGIYNELVQCSDSYFDSRSNTFEFPINKLYYLINTLTNYCDVKFKPLNQLDLDAKYIDIPEHVNFNIKPYSYQLDGIRFGLNHSSWLLLDDQGLGKTLQMIYLAETLKSLYGIEHCFIICGVNSLKYNWSREISKFSKLSHIILGHTISKSGKYKIESVSYRLNQLKNKIDEFFIITNIETLQSKDFYKAFNNSANKFDMIVLDEAHKCKNPASKAAKTLLKLKSKYNIALTGTMIMNNPENAFVPLKWTGNINCTYSRFKNLFNVYGGFAGVQVIGYKNLEILNNLIQRCSLRRLKDEVLDLPDKTYQIDYVEMSSRQQELYNSVLNKITADLDLLDNKKLNIMQELTMNLRLRQVTAYPQMLTSEDIESAKLNRLSQLVEVITAQGDKIVVMNTFKAAAYAEKDLLSSYNPVVCTGDQSDLEINNNKDIFENDDSCKVMICTWQKMGVGHTLTAANYLIFVDTPWTDADFKQSADRIYRIGQSKKVFIITLITKNTYDERVQEIIEKKECLSNYLIDNIDKAKSD